MPEVAERCEPHPTVGEDLADLAWIEPGAREGIRAFTHGEGQQATAGAQRRRRHDDIRPVDAAEEVHEVRKSAADDDRPTEGAQCEAASLREPGCDQLEGRGIDRGHEEAGEEAHDDGRPGAVDSGNDEVGETGAEASNEDHVTRMHPIGHVEDAGHHRAGAEAELHGNGQPRLRGSRQAPDLIELRNHCRSREPRRHPENERRRQRYQRTPAGDFGHIAVFGSVGGHVIDNLTAGPDPNRRKPVVKKHGSRLLWVRPEEWIARRPTPGHLDATDRVVRRLRDACRAQAEASLRRPLRTDRRRRSDV